MNMKLAFIIDDLSIVPYQWSQTPVAGVCIARGGLLLVIHDLNLIK